MTNSVTVNNAAVEKIFSAGATVISHLIDKTVSAGPIAASQTESSLRLDDGWVVLLTDIPAGGIRMSVRFDSNAIVELVKIMMGGGDELGAIGDSMTSEITAQIASTMAEELAGQNSWGANGIVAKVCTDAKLVPPPPLNTWISEFSIDGGTTLRVAVDIDIPASAKTGLTSQKAAPVTAAATAAVPDAPTAATAEEAAVSSSVKQTSPGKAAKVPLAASFSTMTPTPSRGTDATKLDLVHDVPMTVRALLGSSRLPLRDVVGMQNGSVFELNRSSEEPIDLYVNNILIARGEVVVVDDRYAVKISELNPGSSSAR